MTTLRGAGIYGGMAPEPSDAAALSQLCDDYAARQEAQYRDELAKVDAAAREAEASEAEPEIDWDS